jgi:hypothetical protein
MWIHGGQWAKGVSLFSTGWKPGGKCTHQVSTLFGNFAKCFHYSVSIAEKVSNPLKAFPKELPILFRFSPMVFKSFQAHFPTCLGTDLGISFTFPRGSVLLFIKIKNQLHNRQI